MNPPFREWMSLGRMENRMWGARPFQRRFDENGSYDTMYDNGFLASCIIEIPISPLLGFHSGFAGGYPFVQ